MPLVAVPLNEVSTFCDGNFGARDSCALLVTDGAANRRSYDLRAGSAAQHERNRASSEKITRELLNNSFALRNRIFIRLPLRGDLREKENTRSTPKQKYPRLLFSFTPSKIAKDPTPKDS
jgi:hypothetical protein